MSVLLGSSQRSHAKREQFVLVTVLLLEIIARAMKCYRRNKCLPITTESKIGWEIILGKCLVAVA
jgi:hypothetical protein